MLYENTLKVIPVVRRADSNHAIQLSNALNLRVRHSEVQDVTRLVEGELTVLYQRIEHGIEGGRPTKRVRREVEMYQYDATRGELISSGHRMTFKTYTVYKLHALHFGGFLAIDLDYLYWVREPHNPSKPLVSKKLRSC